MIGSTELGAPARREVLAAATGGEHQARRPHDAGHPTARERVVRRCRRHAGRAARA